MNCLTSRHIDGDISVGSCSRFYGRRLLPVHICRWTSSQRSCVSKFLSICSTCTCMSSCKYLIQLLQRSNKRWSSLGGGVVVRPPHLICPLIDNHSYILLFPQRAAQYVFIFVILYITWFIFYLMTLLSPCQYIHIKEQYSVSHVFTEFLLSIADITLLWLLYWVGQFEWVNSFSIWLNQISSNTITKCWIESNWGV